MRPICGCGDGDVETNWLKAELFGLTGGGGVLHTWGRACYSDTSAGALVPGPCGAGLSQPGDWR